MRTRFVIRFAAVSIATLSAASLGASAAHASGDKGFPQPDTAKMASYIHDQLSGQVAGFQFAIAKNGQISTEGTGAGGFARNDTDGYKPMTPTTRIEIASATKNITAAATLSLLEKLGTSVDTRVNGYFPYNWNRGNGWEDVTFRMLLSHRSGLKQQGAQVPNPSAWGTLFGGVQYAVSQPITANSSRAYSNMNYATLRIINARLWRLAEPNANVPSLNATNSGQIELGYVNSHLLQPAGVDGVSCQGNSSTAYVYKAAFTTFNGGDPSLKGADLEACAGHRGLNMSAVDLAKFQIALRDGNIVSQGVRDLMDNASNNPMEELGWDNGSNDVDAGRGGFFYHAGDITVGGGEVHSCQMKMPHDYEAAVIINSPNNTAMTLCRILINAYDAGLK